MPISSRMLVDDNTSPKLLLLSVWRSYALQYTAGISIIPRTMRPSEGNNLFQIFHNSIETFADVFYTDRDTVIWIHPNCCR